MTIWVWYNNSHRCKGYPVLCYVPYTHSNSHSGVEQNEGSNTILNHIAGSQNKWIYTLVNFMAMKTLWNFPKNLSLVNFMAMKTLWKSLWNVKFSWAVTEVSVKHPSISNETHFHGTWKPHENIWKLHEIIFFTAFPWPMKMCFIGY